MPPKAAKKGGQETSKKNEAKKKDKVIQDKTFGIKNKKGTKQQKFIKNVTNQVQHGGKSARQILLDNEKLSKNDIKKAEQAAQLEELNKLFKPVQKVQVVAAGVDPKSVLCAWFKAGTCGKGNKCKFSHDLEIERKTVKRSVYDDGAEEPKEEEMMTEEELQEMVDQKHGEKNKSLPPTSIICRFFLDAVENNKYGWFWACNNGDKCHYRHALPPGFVLKREKKKAEENKEKDITIEELIERERAALGEKLTRVTLETFLAWKDRKRKQKIKVAEKEKAKKKKDFDQGKGYGISGRQMFEFNPDLIEEEDDDEGEVVTYTRESDDDDEDGDGVNVKDIDLDALAKEASQVDTKYITMAKSRGAPTGQAMTNGIDKNTDDESNKLGIAGALPDTNSATNDAIAAAMEATIGGATNDIAIDENLFEDEDLDALEEDLETLDLEDIDA